MPSGWTRAEFASHSSRQRRPSPRWVSASDQGLSPRTTVTVRELSPAPGDRLITAWVASDGPAASGASTSVEKSIADATGGGLASTGSGGVGRAPAAWVSGPRLSSSELTR